MRLHLAKNRLAGLCLSILVAISLCACAGREVVLDLQGAILYEKPRIQAVSYTVTDSRSDGATIVISVTLQGDTGLDASFDITPGIIDRQPMRETLDGTYTGQYSIPSELLGGPYTVIGRLWHKDAGEIVMRDPDLLTISLPR